MDDGDAQLPTPAQQPEGDLCLVCSASQTEDEEYQPPPAKRQRVYSDADKASLTQKVSVFLSYVIDADLLPLTVL